MDIALVVGTACPALGRAVADALGVTPASCSVRPFPDGELEVELRSSVRGANAYVVQSTCAPVGERLLELLLLCDACWRAGARAVSAVVPYFGYARQDRRQREGQPLGARVVAEALGTGRLTRMLAVDLHSRAIEGSFAAPLEHLTAVSLLTEAVRPRVRPESILIAPDLGAVKLAEAFGTRLGLSMAVVHKSRLSGSEVAVRAVIGDVRGRSPIVVDDMISTGGTVVAAVRALREAGSGPEVTVVASHGLLVGEALPRLAEIGVRMLVTTDSVPPPAQVPFSHQVVSLAPLLADAIRRLEEHRPLAELLASR
ncbi:ribose-phosphate pyrophosphokinase [Myxococcus sp. RHSTA-1-4]|uniref:ribose-phosphate diphosphokinase n=1 Tax=Myxococcus sp. RHSTA-1-4 TaxID=2874601 RepID=UPI001CC0681C|nr:ribose-phosphate pyrophosphokinase [Myxococcus sp. RHSTA-1-4]MBZ4420261.1 ribose-phosphate pyrophosphokinase [Myxococcus sp. RHSTA-1-4]